MIKKDHEFKAHPSTNNNKNDIKVNNHFSLTINFGDSLNLLALIGGVYFIRRMVKWQKSKKITN